MATYADARLRIRALSNASAAAIVTSKRPRTAPAAPSPSSDSTAAATAEQTSLDDIRNDAVVHAQGISKEVTALTLALRPPVTELAVVGTLDKLGDILAKLAFIVDLLTRYDGALAKRVSWYILDVLETFQHFLPYATAALDKVPSDRQQKARNELLRSAKTVWTTVDKADQLPQTELAAERQGWRDAITMLDDCLEEMKDLEESIEGGDDDKKEEEEEDTPAAEGRTEQDASARPASRQRQRVNATRHLLRLGRLLVHRLVTKTATSSPAFADSAFLSQTRNLTSRMSALGDDLALELEPPQEGLVEAVDDLCQVEDELADLLEAAVTARGSDELRASEGEWMATWRKQRTGVRSKLDAI